MTDEASAEQSLAAGSIPCPSCSAGSLRPWGHARSRVLRGLRGVRLLLRPRRARCRACGATHVLLPGEASPRRADTVQVLLTALLAHHGGSGAGSIATDLGVPVDTVRSWLRTVTGRAEWLRQEATRWVCLLDPEHPPIRPTGSRLGDALSALGYAAAATRRRLNVAATPWQLIGWVTAGRLLAPLTPTRSG
ncbi:helix-turn-helix domain-containing protein [Intrasporangium chromatireducens]|uniref:helix-turn-helix domain-containing protein n=1 Tax=Intrasporangium chromatireducens TaxID=1386088 RepID=UPI0012DC053E|nr:helix-turn-helix domain-containing protein [Intrasporangium chromatireducens]